MPEKLRDARCQSSKSGELMASCRLRGSRMVIATRRSESANGRPRRITALTTVIRLVVAAIPSASASAATKVNARSRVRRVKAYRMSCRTRIRYQNGE